jgi:glutamate--cysteine ligase
MLRGIHRGIEKESLRVRPDGMLSDRPHPQGLGSALTHPHITTDFSESQPELITGVHRDIGACLQQLTEIHQIVYRNIGDEILWGASMPCGLPDDDSIPIGRYGVSNVGTAKTVYRQGLANRYGRRMQTISGIHYNFSLPEEAWPQLQRADGRSGPGQDYQTEVYFALIRNFRRHSWLLLYLFGASPAVCGSFVEDRLHGLEALKPGVMYLPYATSLRMGPLGYQSDAPNRYSSSQEWRRKLRINAK